MVDTRRGVALLIHIFFAKRKKWKFHGCWNETRDRKNSSTSSCGVEKICTSRICGILFDFHSLFSHQFYLLLCFAAKRASESDKHSEYLYDSKRIYDAIAAKHKKPPVSNAILFLSFHAHIASSLSLRWSSAFVACDNDALSYGVWMTRLDATHITLPTSYH